jgi:hypothetical protein
MPDLQAKPEAVARTYIEAWDRRDMDAVAGLLAPAATFEGPMARAEGAAAFLQAIGEFAQLVTGVEIVALVGDEHQAAVLYDMATTPFGTLRAAEHLQINDGRIVGSRLIFDTFPVRTAGTSAG